MYDRWDCTCGKGSGERCACTAAETVCAEREAGEDAHVQLRKLYVREREERGKTHVHWQNEGKLKVANAGK